MLASFKQLLLDFIKLVDSRLILMLLYDSKSYNQWGSPITAGRLVRYRSEKVKLTGLVALTFCWDGGTPH